MSTNTSSNDSASTDTTDSTSSTTTADTAGTAADASGGAGAENTGTAQAAGSVAELPEWAQAELTRARTEAAKYRRERNAAQKALSDQDSTTGDQESHAEITRLTGQLAEAQHDTAKLRAALAADIPPAQVADFAARLVGDTDDELAADAQRLRGLLGLGERQRPDPSQGEGRDNSAGAAESPAEAFAAFIQQRLD